jgi:hypothetical protein
MKNRFPNLRRADWRSRFVAIARQAAAAREAFVEPPRRTLDPERHLAIRVRFAALRSH